MNTRCPNCRQTLQAPDEAAGKKIRCPRCRTAFYLGQIEPSPSSPPENAPAQPLPYEMEPPASPLQLLEEPAQEITRCPTCNAAMPSQANVCAQCGFNRLTGMTSVEHLRRGGGPEEEEKAPFPILALEFISTLLPGLFRPGLLIVAVILSVVGFAVIGLAIFLTGLGAAIAGMFIGGTGLMVYAQALGVLLYGEWAMLPECLAECDGKRWLLFFVLLFGPFAVLYFIIRPYLPT